MEISDSDTIEINPKIIAKAKKDLAKKAKKVKPRFSITELEQRKGFDIPKQYENVPLIDIPLPFLKGKRKSPKEREKTVPQMMKRSESMPNLESFSLVRKPKRKSPAKSPKRIPPREFEDVPLIPAKKAKRKSPKRIPPAKSSRPKSPAKSPKRKSPAKSPKAKKNVKTKNLNLVNEYNGDLEDLIEDRIVEKTNKKYSPSCLNGVFPTIELKPAQTRVVKKLIGMDKDKKFHGVLVAHGTGTGKTEIILGSVACVIKNKLAKKIILVTTKSLISEFRKRMDKYEFQIPEGIVFEIMTYDLFYRYYSENKIGCGNDTFLIIDEVHNLRNPASVRYKNIQSCAYKAKLVLALTATPLVNGFEDIVPLVRLIMREPISNSFTNIELTDIFENPQSHVQQIKAFKDKISWFYDTNSEDFPKAVVQESKIKMSPDYEKAYIKLEEGVFTDLGSPKDLSKFYTALRTTTALINDKESTKFNEILKLLNLNEQTVLYSEFIDKGVKIYSEFMDRKKIPYVIITGETTIVQRKKAVDAYNKGEIRVLIISKAGELGLDLQNTRNIIFANLPWNYATYEQIIGRGIRYKSHHTLPKNERKVNIWIFIQTKSNENIASPKKQQENLLEPRIKSFPSIDAYLWNLIQEKKLKKDKLDQVLQTLSIQ